MTNKELKERTQKFGLDVLNFVESLSKTKSNDVIGRQLMRAAFSVGANYRAACRAQSYSHFISKIGTVEEESDECLFWLEMFSKSGINKSESLNKLMAEANELTAIFTSTRKTAKKNKSNQ